MYSCVDKIIRATMRGSTGAGQMSIRIPSSIKNACHMVNAMVAGIYSLMQPNTAMLTFFTPSMSCVACGYIKYIAIARRIRYGQILNML
jgi:hypothetical protein